ncbi:MAG: tripartite tricarboxylate transporter substrate-binding protein [Acidiferrobacterales bacterium]
MKTSYGRAAFLVSVLLGLSLTVPALAAEAMKPPKNYPLRDLIIIVPYGTGGGSDQVSRNMAAAIKPFVRVPVRVVNQPGEGGRAAIPGFVSGSARGYTILQHTDDIAALYASGKIKQNPAVDWTPLAIVQVTFSQLYIRPGDKHFSDWRSFLAYAKARPGKILVANVGRKGSMEQINMIKLEQALGFKTKQVSYDNPAERYAALTGGKVDVLFEQPGDVRTFLQNRRIKPILTLLKKRPATFAEVPSLTDVGANFKPLLRFRGFYVRNDVPKDRRQYLEWLFAQGFESEAFQAFNRDRYILADSHYGTSAARELLSDVLTYYQRVYTELGLTK